MKQLQTQFCLLALFFLFFSQQSFSQKDKIEPNNKKETKKEERDDKERAKLEKILAKKQRRHVVKVNTLAYPLGKLSLDYEYRITRKSAVGFNYGMPMEQEVPDKLIEELDIQDLNITNAKLEGTSYRPHYRLYTGKRGAPRGFYLEPYLKYHEYSANLDGDYFYEEDNRTYVTESTLELDGFGGGFQIGQQYLIGNRVALDLSILGLDLTSTNITMRANDQSNVADKSYLDDFKTDLEDAIEDLPDFLKDDITVTGGSQQGYLQADGDSVLLPGFRFTLSVGFAF